MTLPGFTAEAALGPSAQKYRGLSSSASSSQHLIEQ